MELQSCTNSFLLPCFNLFLTSRSFDIDWDQFILEDIYVILKPVVISCQYNSICLIIISKSENFSPAKKLFIFVFVILKAMFTTYIKRRNAKSPLKPRIVWILLFLGPDNIPCLAIGTLTVSLSAHATSVFFYLPLLNIF